jgi:hypothetical protein
VGLCLSNCVALSNTIEFLKEHALKRLCSKMEQNRPCFGDRLLIDIHEVQLVYIAVHQKMFILFVHLRQFLVSELQVLVVLLVLRLRSLSFVTLSSCLLLSPKVLVITRDLLADRFNINRFFL